MGREFSKAAGSGLLQSHGHSWNVCIQGTWGVCAHFLGWSQRGRGAVQAALCCPGCLQGCACLHCLLHTLLSQTNTVLYVNLWISDSSWALCVGVHVHLGVYALVLVWKGCTLEHNTVFSSLRRGLTSLPQILRCGTQASQLSLGVLCFGTFPQTYTQTYDMFLLAVSHMA